jgi:hypothetical protein
MNEDYLDIRERIPENPKWWDENAVPRYCEFHPQRCANVYSREVALVRITCQGCGQEFPVAFSSGHLENDDDDAIAVQIKAKTLHYGDPPNVDCCAAGQTMNSEPRRVLEYWHRPFLDWVRNPELEVGIEPDWVGAVCGGR